VNRTEVGNALAALTEFRAVRQQPNKGLPTLLRLMPSGEDVSSNLTKLISSYMVLSLFRRLNSVSNPAGANYGLSYDILKDSEMIIAQVLRAFENPSKLKFPAFRGNLKMLQSFYLGGSRTTRDD
jgi:hypothetical protein